MVRIIITVVALVFFLQGSCPAQSLLDSVFGSGGLGIWNSDPQNQFAPNTVMQDPQYGAGQQQQMSYPSQTGYQDPNGPYQQPQYQQGYANPNQQQGAVQPPVSYAPSPQGGNYAPQAQQQYAPPGQMPAQQYAQPAPPAAARPLRPGQYRPEPPPTYTSNAPISAEELPAGAVRVTTTTPDGTTVEYYPPAEEQQQYPPNPRQIRQPKPKQATAKPARQKQAVQSEMRAPGAESSTASSIAMPKPVEVQKAQDPRYSWGANRGAPR